jgi:hypothetical protein
MMSSACLYFVAALLAADDPPAKDAALEQRLREINLAEARHWEMWLDKDRQTKAELIERPIYLWTNPTTTYGVQHGSVFIWAHEGRPIVVGSIFGHPLANSKRRLIHEFHAMSPTLLSAVCDDAQNSVWEPTGKLATQPLVGAPPPEATEAKRLSQMRKLSREFGGHTVDWRKERWELRVLAQPLYRYEVAGQGIIDGGLFALVSNAGTDPEVFLLLEATKEGWRYALLRFADSSLWVTRGEKEIWTAVRGESGHAQLNNADRTYQVFQKPIIDDPVVATAEATP